MEITGNEQQLINQLVDLNFFCGYIVLQGRAPKFDAQVSVLVRKLKFIQFAVFVNNTISVLDSPWGKLTFYLNI